MKKFITKSFFGVMLFFLVFLAGCSTVTMNKMPCSRYLYANGTEITFGNVYEDKYWSKITGAGECVKIVGFPTSLGSMNLNDEDAFILLNLSVKAENANGGRKNLEVLASPKFDKQLQGLKTDREVEVRGRVISLKGSLAIILQELSLQ
jgi:hypothetical protein